MLSNGWLCVGFLLFVGAVGIVLVLYDVGEIKSGVVRSVRKWLDMK